MADGVAAVPALPSKIGRYEVAGFIATGGMAELFLGRTPDTHKPVVIKRILPHLARQSSFVSMFIDEARLGSMIRHPNLAEIYELGQVGSELFLVMEYLQGESLSGLVRRLVVRDERLSHALAAHIVAEACAGLGAAHELTDEKGVPQHVVHRDVALQNVFVTYDGNVKVLDFGIAVAAHRLAQTATGSLKGTFAYMSPEQCRGEPLDARSDLFSLGIVLYELSTQRRLFKRASEFNVLKAVCEDAIPKPTRGDRSYPKKLEDICLRALDRDRDKRFPVGARATRGAARGDRRDRARGGSARVARCRDGAPVRRPPQRETPHGLDGRRRRRALSNVVAVEADEGIDVPQVSHASLTPTSRASTPLPIEEAKRHRLGWMLAAAGIVCALGAVAIVIGRSHHEPPPPVHHDVAALPPVAPSPDAMPAEVVVTIATTPPGAAITIDGTASGTTPVELRLARRDHATLELHLAGYVPLVQELALDRDQRMLLSLEAVPPVAVKHAPTAASHKPPVTPVKPPDSGFHRFN